MLNYYYSLELNLDNDHVKTKLLKQLGGLIPPNVTEFSLNSRFFLDSQACFDALNDDLESKIDLLDIRHASKLGTNVIAINETNPIYMNSPEDIAEHKKTNPGFNEYLETWGENELVRLTYTTETVDENVEEPPLLDDEKALLFRYTMHELEDDLKVPEGKTFIENSSSALN
jgi:hypothetical protein